MQKYEQNSEITSKVNVYEHFEFKGGKLPGEAMREARGWRLSPAFDVNPTPGDNPKYLRSAIDFDNDEASPEAALSAHEWYRLDRGHVVTLRRDPGAVG